MKLSVLITTYNLQEYIQETLESVLSQKVDFAFEIIVGDDGSDDRTAEIVSLYVEKYPEKIRLLVMEREQGKKYSRIDRASRNRISLIKEARGDYLIFLDGDDVYTDVNKLQKQMDILEHEDYQDCIACGHNIWKYWSEEEKELINPYKKAFKVDSRKYWKDCMYFHSDTLMFRNVFKRGFPDEIHPGYYDDNMMVYVLLRYGKLAYLPDVMVNYRQVGNSSWNSVDELEKNIINLIDWNMEGIIDNRYRKESTIRHMYNLVYQWKNAKEIPKEIEEKYLAQMERDGLEKAKDWLTYAKLPLSKRVKMSAWLMGWLIPFTINKIKKTIWNPYI